MAQQHGSAENRRQWVGLALPGDIGRGPVNRLIQAELAVPGASRAQAGRGQHAHRPGQHRRLIGQDVAKHILGDDHIELRGRRIRSIAQASTSRWRSVTSG